MLPNGSTDFTKEGFDFASACNVFASVYFIKNQTLTGSIFVKFLHFLLYISGASLLLWSLSLFHHHKLYEKTLLNDHSVAPRFKNLGGSKGGYFFKILNSTLLFICLLASSLLGRRGLVSPYPWVSIR